MSAEKELWVYAEQREGKMVGVVQELLSQGQVLCEKSGYTLCAILPSENGAELCQELYNFGAEKVYTLDDPKLADYQNDYYSRAVAQLINEKRPEIVLYGATSIGRSLAPTVAVMVNAGLTADCTELDFDVDEGNLLQTRPAFGGNIMATIICPNHRPQMATVRANVFKKNKRSSAEMGEQISCPVDLSGVPERMRRLESVREAPPNRMDLHAAQFIVSGGRGVGNPENFKIIDDLAAEMGAAVGASRATVDAGWIAPHHLVGQTGKTVCPVVYIACGISGAIQHLAGIQRSELIIAINKDPDAPIFDIADFGLIGDLNELVPEFQKQIAAAKTS
ncbi:MAG: electron transfer flavoprotein subunit alpha/FixB family protein [Pontiella sp.]